MKRFGSVTVLNGHVHQLMKKVEGNITFHTAAPTAYPLPHGGDGPAPKPVVVPAGQLHQALGIRQAHLVPGRHGLAIADQELP
jgi:hypothetical protein